MRSHGKPDKAEYTKRLHAMLMPGVDSSSLMVANDPISGDESFLFDQPFLSVDGDILQLSEQDLGPDGAYGP